MKKLLQSLFILMFVAGAAMAQDRTISGTVTGKDDGLPIPGVSVKIVGTSTGTSTDANGKYALKVASGQASIEFSSIGYLRQVIAIGSSNTVNVAMSTDAKELGEVVVVAYGTAKKEAITGAVSTLGSAEIEKRVVTNVTNALAGLAPGITVNSGNGQPGSGAGVRLRGFGSFNASSAPLYVVDGAVFDGDLGDINPNDIESVSVLKDATSAALYGSRAGNGVIIITTKRGKSATPQLSGTFSQGISERGTPEYNRLDAYQYYPAVWQALKNNSRYSASPALTEAAAAQKATNDVRGVLVYNPFNVPNNQIVGVDGLLNPNASLLYNDFDWYKPLQRTGKRTEASMSVSERKDKSDYYVSLGYLKDNGYILKSDFKRFNGRINVNSEVRPWLKTGLNISGSFSDGNLASDNSTDNNTSFINAFATARGMGPIYPVHAFDATGNPIMNPLTGEQWFDYGGHPGAVLRPQGASPGRHVGYETMLNENTSKRNLLSGRSYVDVKFLKDFTFTPSISIDIRNNNTKSFNNALVGDGASYAGLLEIGSSNIRSFTFNQILNYNKSVGEHNFTALLGHENYDFTYRISEVSKTSQVAVGNTELDGFVTPLNTGGRQDRETLESYFSRFTYNYMQKYFLEGSLRRDGSSRFNKSSRWGTFYSVGGSWSISKEAFMEDFSWVDDLRAKVSYGQVGNKSILNSDGTQNYYGYQSFYDLGSNNGTEPGLLISSVASPDLKWESVNSFNAGFSFSLFKKRLFGEFDFFKKGSDNLIFSIPQPLSDPVTSIVTNIGSMYNTGVEFQLGGDLIRTGDFTWGMITNWTMFKNKITKLPAETPTITTGTKRREVGGDYYRYWLRQYAGVDPSDGSALYIPADGTPAASMRTVNGTQYVTNQTLAKFGYSGTAIPDLIGSVNNSFRYKDLSLSFLITYQLGGKFYDSVYQDLMSISSYGKALHKDILNSWTLANPNSATPRIDAGATTNINATSSRFLVSASYISFRNVNLSYNLPKNWLNKVDISNARVFVAGENLGLISRRRGMNPSESFDGLNANTYLPSRIFSLGVNFSL
jgi:TonB-linked SusC/RagA family outer membrane protein